jgi:hypothetical protein
VYDLANLSSARYTGLADGHVFPLAISSDAKRLLAGLITSNTDCQCCVGDVTASGEIEVLTAHLPGSYFYPGPWTGDGSGFFVRTTAGGDRVQLAFFSMRDHTLTTVDAPGWDVEDVVVSADGRTVVWTVNQDGRSILRGRRDNERLELPAWRGEAPLRLMWFLDDAYRRQVLRQANGYYEFRHRSLQRYLAEPSPELPVGASGASAGKGGPT